MRRVPILLLVLLAAATLRAQEAESDVRSLIFDEVEWNVGRIEEADGPVSHTFHYRNEADHSVAIERVYSSCGCTTSDYSRRPLKAGGTGEVVVTFDPEGRRGRFDRTITLVYDGGQGRTELHIKGRVNPRPRTIEDEFPYDLGGGLRCDATFRSFGKIARGDTRSMTVTLLNTSDATITLAPEWIEQSGALELFLPEQVAPGERVLLVMTYSTEGELPDSGLLRDSFRLLIDGTAGTDENLFTTRALGELKASFPL